MFLGTEWAVFWKRGLVELDCFEGFIGIRLGVLGMDGVGGIHDGMSDDLAVERAWLTVEQDESGALSSSDGCIVSIHGEYEYTMLRKKCSRVAS